MRLLLTTDTIGGVWSFSHTLASGLLLAGHTVGMVSFGRTPSSDQSASIQALAMEFPRRFYFASSAAPLEWMPHNDRAWDEGCRVLLDAIEEFAPQLLHSSQLCFGRLNSLLPVLVTAHSDVLSWAESTLSPDGVLKLEQTASQDWLERYRSLVMEGLHQAAEVVAPTNWMAYTVARLFGLELIPKVIWNGIARRAADSLPRKLQAVTAGRLWDKGKGLSILNEIDPVCPFLIVGESHPEGMALNNGFKWLGSLPHHNLLALFAESAIYVATSLYEPFGLAAVEAAEHGCAIVARDISSFHEVWGDAALYFTSAHSLQQLLVGLANNPRRLQGAQCRARQRAARYTAQTMAESYLALYESLLARDALSQEPMLAHA